MALRKCNECKKEISTSVTTCPSCGSKKPFKGRILTRDETKSISWKERKVFEKAGGEVTTGGLEKTGNFILITVIILFLYNVMKPESEEKRNRNIQNLKETIKAIPAIKVSQNYSAYSKLSEYYPDNVKYKEKKEFYKSRINFSSNCMVQAYKNNQNSLSNPSTFDSITLDEYKIEQWTDINTFVYQSSFTGKNSFGIEQKFVAKYICNYDTKNGNIVRLFIKKAR